MAVTLIGLSSCTPDFCDLLSKQKLMWNSKNIHQIFYPGPCFKMSTGFPLSFRWHSNLPLWQQGLTWLALSHSTFSASLWPLLVPPRHLLPYCKIFALGICSKSFLLPLHRTVSFPNINSKAWPWEAISEYPVQSAIFLLIPILYASYHSV